jgi:hypothetical protein
MQKYWYREHYLKGDCEKCPYFSKNMPYEGVRRFTACFGCGEEHYGRPEWIFCEEVDG